MVRVFTALEDPTRLELLLHLATGEKNVGRLTALVRFNQPMVSYHLKLLRRCRLVRGRRKGKTVIYSLGERCASDGRALSITVTPRYTISIRVRGTRR